MTKVKPRVKVPKTAEIDEIIEIKTLISHPMHSGRAVDGDGNLVPRQIINSFRVYFNSAEIMSKDYLGLFEEMIKNKEKYVKLCEKYTFRTHTTDFYPVPLFGCNFVVQQYLNGVFTPESSGTSATAMMKRQKIVDSWKEQKNRLDNMELWEGGPKFHGDTSWLQDNYLCPNFSARIVYCFGCRKFLSETQMPWRPASKSFGVVMDNIRYCKVCRNYNKKEGKLPTRNLTDDNYQDIYKIEDAKFPKEDSSFGTMMMMGGESNGYSSNEISSVQRVTQAIEQNLMKKNKEEY